MANDQIEVFGALTAKKGLVFLKKEVFDCIVWILCCPMQTALNFSTR
jgi:hypothetical protein